MSTALASGPGPGRTAPRSTGATCATRTCTVHPAAGPAVTLTWRTAMLLMHEALSRARLPRAPEKRYPARRPARQVLAELASRRDRR